MVLIGRTGRETILLADVGTSTGKLVVDDDPEQIPANDLTTESET